MSVAVTWLSFFVVTLVAELGPFK